jgi:uncharacterized protein
VEPLTIHIDEIEESGQIWEADLPRELIDEALQGEPPTEFHAAGAAHVRAKVTKMGREMLFQARFTVPVEGQCKRCLKKVRLDEPIDVTLNFVPRDAPEPARGRSEPAASRGRPPGGKTRVLARDTGEAEIAASSDAETVDEEPYTGKTIDLAPALREQILLAVPPPPLCDEACKGLCPQCGKDLNQGDCGCERASIDPRWAALKSIQVEKKEK